MRRISDEFREAKVELYGRGKEGVEWSLTMDGKGKWVRHL